MCIAITGSNGFIGSNLAAHLERSGLRYIRIDHRSTLTEIASQLSASHVTSLIHLASIFIAEHKPEDVDLLVDSNIGFGARIFEACRIAGVREVVVTGSSWQHFGERSDVAANLYGALKTGLEAVSRFYTDAYRMSVAFLKLYDSFGKGDQRPKLVPHLLNLRARILAGEPGSLDLSGGQQIVDFTHVQNTVDAIMLASKRASQQESRFESFKVSGRELMTLRDFVDLFQKVGGVELEVRWGARPYREREIMSPWIDGPELPGFEPRIKLHQGLTELFV